MSVLNDIERYHNQHGEQLGLAEVDLYALVRAITDAIAPAESAWEVLERLPGVAGDAGRRDVRQVGATQMAILFARVEVFGRAATVAIDVRLRPLGGEVGLR